jgi:hypothetical protein
MDLVSLLLDMPLPLLAAITMIAGILAIIVLGSAVLAHLFGDTLRRAMDHAWLASTAIPSALVNGTGASIATSSTWDNIDEAIQQAVHEAVRAAVRTNGPVEWRAPAHTVVVRQIPQPTIWRLLVRTVEPQFLVQAVPRMTAPYSTAELRLIGHDVLSLWGEVVRPYLGEILVAAANGSRTIELHPDEARDVTQASLEINSLLARVPSILRYQEDAAESLSLEELLERLEKRPLLRDFVHVDWAGRVDRSRKVFVRVDGLGLLFDELARNSRRHGGATAARLVVTHQPVDDLPTNVWLHLVDNGSRGFDPDAMHAIQAGGIRDGGLDPIARSQTLGRGLNLCAALARESGGVLAAVVDNTISNGPDASRTDLWFSTDRPGVRISVLLPVVGVVDVDGSRQLRLTVGNQARLPAGDERREH